MSFDFLIERKEKIETDFGEELTWERLDDKRASRIKYELAANLMDKAEWDMMIDFMVDGMVRLERTLKPHLRDLNKVLKKG